MLLLKRSLVLLALMILTASALGIDRVPKPRNRALNIILNDFGNSADDLVSQYRRDLKTIPQVPRGGTFDSFFDVYARFTFTTVDGLRVLTDQTVIQTEIVAPTLTGTDAILGTGGDLDRTLLRLESELHCTSFALMDAQEVLAGLQIQGQQVLTSVNTDFDLPLQLAPPPSKKVDILGGFAARVNNNPIGRVFVHGLAPAGATVKVTVNCGGNMQMAQVIADANCRWSISFNVPAPINCAVTAEDVNNPANNDSAQFGTC